MKSEFEILALSVKKRLEARLSHSLLENNYLYKTLNEISAEYENGDFSPKNTDLGVAAAKIFDSNSKEDNELVRDISRLVELYKKSRVSLRIKKN